LRWPETFFTDTNPPFVPLGRGLFVAIRPHSQQLPPRAPTGPRNPSFVVPELTLGLKCAVTVNNPFAHRQQAALKKYINRGLTVMHVGRDSEWLLRLLGVDVRRQLGDSRCYTLDL